MNKSKRSCSYAVSSVIASIALFYAIRLSALGRTAIDWVVMGLVICALLYSLAQLTRRLYRAGGTKDAWHVQRTVLLWIVGLFNTALLRPEHIDSWRPWVGWLFLVAAAVGTVTLFIEERAAVAGSEALRSTSVISFPFSASPLDFHIKTLAETRSYLLGHFHESVFLVEKSTGLKTELTDHYGNPSCGVIGPNEDWVVVGGCGLELHRIGGESEVLFRQGMSPLGEAQGYWFVHDMRLEGTDTVRILFDPWDKYASVWTVRCPEFKLCKIQDGPSLADEPYRDNVDF